MFQSGENGGSLAALSVTNNSTSSSSSLLCSKRKGKKGLFLETSRFYSNQQGLYKRRERKEKKKGPSLPVYFIDSPLPASSLSLVFRSPLLPPTNLFRPSARCSPLRRALSRSRSLCEIPFGLIYIYYRVLGLFFFLNIFL